MKARRRQRGGVPPSCSLMWHRTFVFGKMLFLLVIRWVWSVFQQEWNAPFSTIFWWRLAFCSCQKRGFSASYWPCVSFLGSSAAKKAQSWPTGFGFLFFCRGAQGIFWALVVAAGGVLATLFIPQIRGRLLTALTWAYLQESSLPGVWNLPVEQSTTDCGHRRSLHHICHGASFHMLE